MDLSSLVTLNTFDFLFDSVKLKEHSFYLYIILLPQMTYLMLKLINLSVLLFLSLNKYDGMIEPFLLKMTLIILPEDFYFAT
jgi:hypothetical protein